MQTWIPQRLLRSDIKHFVPWRFISSTTTVTSDFIIVGCSFICSGGFGLNLRTANRESFDYQISAYTTGQLWLDTNHKKL